MTNYQYFNNFVNWSAYTTDLTEMIDSSIIISRRCFMQYVNRAQLKALELQLGYCRSNRTGLTMAGDYQVTYHRSTIFGERCYYFRQSAIEYVFTPFI